MTRDNASSPPDVTMSAETSAGTGAAAAAELAQELSLVIRALFVQLLPTSADVALSTVSGPGEQVAPGPEDPLFIAVGSTLSDATQPLPKPLPGLSPDFPTAVGVPLVTRDEVLTPAPGSAAPHRSPLLPSPPPSVAVVQVPIADSPSTAVPPAGAPTHAEMLSIQAPAIRAPKVQLPVSQVAVAAETLAEPPLAPAEHSPKPDHRSQAMLAEIGFLDEDSPHS